MLANRRAYYGGRGSRDEKIIAVPVNDPNYNCYKDIDELPSHRMDEIEHFFEVYKTLEKGKTTSIIEVQNREAAEGVIQACIDEYIKKFQM